jgi:hypothetical protein
MRRRPRLQADIRLKEGKKKAAAERREREKQVDLEKTTNKAMTPQKRMEKKMKKACLHIQYRIQAQGEEGASREAQGRQAPRRACIGTRGPGAC